MSHTQSEYKVILASGIVRFTCCLFFSAFIFQTTSYAQSNQDSVAEITSIYQIMERNDLSISEIQRLADEYFAKHGSGRGSGYKQYQRWLYERRFHVDDQGYLIDPMIESYSYQSFIHRNGASLRNAEPWEELGPFAWQSTTGWNPGIGRITSVAIHPSNESIIYVSSPGGGIWKSSNGGTTWTPLLDNVNSAWMFVYNLRIDPSNQSVIYAAIEGGGVIKSTDAGITWNATGSGPSTSRKVVVHPSNSNIVLATALNGVWRSINAGSTWTQVHTANSEDIEFKPGNPDIVYVSGNTNSIKRSNNNGVSWTTIGAAEGITHSGRTLLGVTADNSNIVYAVQSNGAVFGRMYKSSDAGLNFITTVVGDPAMGTNYFGYFNDGTGTSGQALYDMAICVNPANEDEVHIGGIICWKSLDGGFSFESVTAYYIPNGYGYNHADIHALEWINATMYSGSDGGIYKSSDNGDEWIDLSEGLGIRQVYRLSSAKTNSSILNIGSQDNGTSYRQSSGNWRDWLGADGMDNMISPTDPNIAFGTSNSAVVNDNGKLYKTVDGGLTFDDITEPSSGEWITPVAMHPTNHDILYVGWTGLWKSINGGDSWLNISSGVINQKLNTLSVSSANPNFIYASVNTKLYRTTNGGTTWDSTAMTNTVSSIYISKVDPQKIWVTLTSTSNNVRLSTNGGASFTNISAGLPALAARSVVVDEADSDGVYVGMNIGVYYRNDLEPSWVPFGTGLPLVAINDLDIHHDADLIRVATYGRGVWENGLELTNGSDCIEYAYVPNSSSNTVSVVELPSNALITTVPVGTQPYAVCHTSTGDKVFVANISSDNVSVISTVNHQVIATTALPSDAGPTGLGITPDNARLFVANSDNGTVSVINTTTYSVIQTIVVNGEPFTVQIRPDGAFAYVTDFDLYRISVINTSNYDVVSTINMSYPLSSLKFTPNGELAFVQTGLDKIYVINSMTHALIDSVLFPSGYGGTDLCISPNGQTVYAGFYIDSPGPSLAVVDVSTLEIETYATGFCCGTGGVSINGDGTLVYVTNPEYNKVSVISTATNAAVGFFSVGNYPTGYGDFVVNCDTSGASCDFTFYDSGGPDNPYANDEDMIETLCPENPSDKVQMEFSVFALEEGYDFLKIFDGNSISSPPLHTGLGFTGYDNPGTFISTHASGCLTTHFTSDFSIVDEGWVAEVSCVPDNGGPPCEEFAYVPHHGMDQVRVLNLQTGSFVDTIPVAAFPSIGCHSNDATKMYMDNSFIEEGCSVSIISTVSNTVIDSIQLPTPFHDITDMCMSPDDSRLFVSTSSAPPGTAKLYIINGSTHTILETLNIGGTIIDMQVTPDGTKLYATNNRRDSVWVINVLTGAIMTRIPMLDWTTGIAISPDGSKVFVGCFDESLQVINTATNTVIDNIPLYGRPTGLCFTLDGQKLYASNHFIDSVSVINPVTHVLEQNIYVPEGPDAINASSDSSKIYVFNDDSDDISILSTITNTIINTIESGGDGFTGLGDFVLNCSDTDPSGICGSSFFDSGGPNQNYENDEDLITTLCPENAQQVIGVEFLDFAVESEWDALYVFDGNSINSPLISSGNPITNGGFPEGGYYGLELPGPFLSSDASGCITFMFLSDNSFTLDGWEAIIQCEPRIPNDFCEDAILIQCDEEIPGSNVNATSGPAPLCEHIPGSNGVWYSFVGTGELITLSTCHPGTDFDTQIHVYSGNCSGLVCVTSNDDDLSCSQLNLHSTVEFISSPGVEYFILVSGFQSNVGQFVLQSNCGEVSPDNNALHLDGVNDNVYGATSPLFELVDGTIELWVKPESKPTSQTFICYRNDPGTATRYLFNFLGNLSGLGFWNGSAYSTFAYSFTPNQWYHLAFVDDAVNTKIYINGAYVGAFSIQFSSASGSGLHLVMGYDIPLSEYFKGAIDEVRIWSIPLSESILLENMSCGVPVSGDCLIAYYRFNQGIGGGPNGAVTFLTDHSGNGLNGALNNFTLDGEVSNWIAATNGVEGECENPSVSNVVQSHLNSGYASLRATIACAESGSTVTFSNDLPSTILSLLSPISINKDINVDGTSVPGLMLDATASTYAFDVSILGMLDLFSIYVKCGTHNQYSGIRNFGFTGLHNVTFETNLTTPIFSNYNQLFIYNQVMLLR